MMNTSSFDDFIEQQSQSTQITVIDWHQSLEEWLEYLNAFYSLIEMYLQPYLEAGKLRIEKHDTQLQEEYIGDYIASELIIYLGNNTIRLKPIGTHLIAAKGRVDMLGPKGEVKFVLVDKNAFQPQASVKIWIEGEESPPAEKFPPLTEWVWKIATPPRRSAISNLSGNHFKLPSWKWLMGSPLRVSFSGSEQKIDEIDQHYRYTTSSIRLYFSSNNPKALASIWTCSKSSYFRFKKCIQV